MHMVRTYYPFAAAILALLTPCDTWAQGLPTQNPCGEPSELERLSLRGEIDGEMRVCLEPFAIGPQTLGGDFAAWLLLHNARVTDDSGYFVDLGTRNLDAGGRSYDVCYAFGLGLAQFGERIGSRAWHFFMRCAEPHLVFPNAVEYGDNRTFYMQNLWVHGANAYAVSLQREYDAQPMESTLAELTEARRLLELIHDRWGESVPRTLPLEDLMCPSEHCASDYELVPPPRP